MHQLAIIIPHCNIELTTTTGKNFYTYKVNNLIKCKQKDKILNQMVLLQ